MIYPANTSSSLPFQIAYDRRKHHPYYIKTEIKKISRGVFNIVTSVDANDFGHVNTSNGININRGYLMPIEFQYAEDARLVHEMLKAFEKRPQYCAKAENYYQKCHVREEGWTRLQVHCDSFYTKDICKIFHQTLKGRFDIGYKKVWIEKEHDVEPVLRIETRSYSFSRSHLK
jgi:hypothetical protein